MDVPAIDDVLASSKSLFLVAVYASGWIVQHTIVPEAAQELVAVLLILVPIGALVAVYRAAGINFNGGRCRARTSSGERCKLSRRPGNDLCHVHQRTYDVELYEE